MTAGCDGARPRRGIAGIAAVVVLLSASGCGDEPIGANPSCGDDPTLEPGELLPSTLTDDDPRLEGSFIDYYTLELDAVSLVVVEMRSSQVDPFLYLWRGNEDTAMAQAFDPRPDATERIARLEITLPGGCYLVGASTWSDEAGSYSIRATVAAP